MKHSLGNSILLCSGVAAVVLVLGAGGSGAEKPLENKLPDAVAKALDKADELQVYSLNGDTNVKGGWHGAKMLGKTAVKKADRKSLATAVKKGIVDGAGGARCFIPRHGLSFTHDGTTYDLVICFECHWVYIYTNKSDKPTVLTVSDSPRKLLDKILSAAKVPLAKGAK